MSFPHDPYAPQDPYAVDASGAVSHSASGDSTPKGTSSEVLSWVNSDKVRAQQALDAETATAKPRKGLVEELEEILAESDDS